MERRASKGLCLSSCCLMLFGCSNDLLLAFSAEERINKAIPVSPAVTSAKKNLLEQSTAAEKTAIDREYASKLKLRALTCGKGASPSFFASKEAIQQQVGNAACFTAYDSDLERWLGFNRVSLLAAKPPVRPVPVKTPGFVLSNAFIQSAHFAENSGMALLETQKAIQIVEVETSNILYEEQKGSSQFGKLSPNGRLFTLSADGRTRFRDAETGALLLELPNAVGFQWLDNGTALFHRDSIYGKLAFFDVKAGREIESKGIPDHARLAGKVPGTDSAFVIVSSKSAAKVELTSVGTDRQAMLVQEKPIAPTNYAFNTSGVTADGKTSFSVRSESLSLINLETLKQEEVVFSPYQLQTATTSAEPDKVLLKGFVRGSNRPGFYMYSITGGTLSRLDPSQLLSERLLYIPSLKRQATIADSKIAILDELPLEQPVALEKIRSEAQEQMNQQKLEMAMQIEAAQGDNATRHVTAISGSSHFARSRLSGDRLQETGVNVPATGIMAEFAKNAQIEAVGVYQGANGQRDAHRTGNVEVRVRKSTRPIFLVLSAYEKVQWRLVIEQGAQLSGVLVSGYYPSQVTGAGTARVTMSGSEYAYEKNSRQFAALNSSVVRQVGKPIAEFQGRYEGSSFSVGGN